MSLDASNSIAAISRRSMWTANTFTIASKTPLFSSEHEHEHEHENLFQSIKATISGDLILAVPSTDYPLRIHVDLTNAEASWPHYNSTASSAKTNKFSQLYNV